MFIHSTETITSDSYGDTNVYRATLRELLLRSPLDTPSNSPLLTKILTL